LVRGTFRGAGSCHCEQNRPPEGRPFSNAEFPMSEKPKQHIEEERRRIESEEDEVTISSDESFPASDPPSFNPGVTGSADTKKIKKKPANDQ
jgi:hypothetical protein